MAADIETIFYAYLLCNLYNWIVYVVTTMLTRMLSKYNYVNMFTILNQ